MDAMKEKSNSMGETERIRSTASQNLTEFSIDLIKVSMDYLFPAPLAGRSVDRRSIMSRLKEFAGVASFYDEPLKYPYPKEMLKELIRDHERIILQFRKNMLEFTQGSEGLTMAETIYAIIEKHKLVASRLKKYF
jgi:hypothetical protein